MVDRVEPQVCAKVRKEFSESTAASTKHMLSHVTGAMENPKESRPYVFTSNDRLQFITSHAATYVMLSKPLRRKDKERTAIARDAQCEFTGTIDHHSLSAEQMILAARKRDTYSRNENSNSHHARFYSKMTASGYLTRVTAWAATHRECCPRFRA